MYDAKVILDSVTAEGHRLTTMQVTFPRFILAEVNTHRMFCLAGDSELEFDLPAGTAGGRSKRVYRMRLDTFVDRWHNGSAPRMNNGGRGTNRQPMRERLASMRIRQLNEESGLIQTSSVTDCFVSGVKEVFEVSAGRFSVAGSAEHRILTLDGWKTIGELSIGDLLVVRRFGKTRDDKADPERLKKIGGRWRSIWQREMRDKLYAEFGGCQECGSENGLQIHHKEPVYMAPERAFDESNVLLLCDDCHDVAHEKQGWQGGTYLYGDTQPVTGIKLRGTEPTYDLSVAGDFPNFIANGIVVHNSRNSASSRAIPVERRIEQLEREPFIPDAFGKNQAGMQAGDVLSVAEQELARESWVGFLADAIKWAQRMADCGVHKQWANRLIEAGAWHTAVISSTEWGNHEGLRCHPAASPEYQIIAKMMRAAKTDSAPALLRPGDWHLPYVTIPGSRKVYKDDLEAAILLLGEDPMSSNMQEMSRKGKEVQKVLRKVSAGRCAAVSFERQELKNFENDIARYSRLRSGGHMSPFEHPARPMTAAEYHHLFSQKKLEWNEEKGEWDWNGEYWHFCGNVQGWIQERKLIPNEHDFSLVSKERA